ncbi:MAG: ureidoglycolate lyase [Pseudomonadota bacterium]
MTNQVTLTVRELNTSTFAAYGDVIETSGFNSFFINQGTTERFHDLAEVDVGDREGRPIISIFRGQAFSLPIPITMLERHPLGSQAFIPITPYPWLLVVAPAEADGSPGVPEAFLAGSHQGVSYRKGVWHHPLLALHKTSDFIVVDRGGEGENLEEFTFAEGGYAIEALPHPHL